MKPASMSLKEYLIKKLSLRIMQPEKVILTVITDQFDQANDALNTNDQVEISGFGKYVFNRKKAIKKMDLWLVTKEDLETRLTGELTDTMRRNLEVKLEAVEKKIKSLKPKMI
jgi:nucleoid DNA-binding protein